MLTVRLAALMLSFEQRGDVEEGVDGATVKILALILAASEEDVEASLRELVARGVATFHPRMAS